MENLDVMNEAVRYNRFLKHQITLAAGLAPECKHALDFGAGNGRFITEAASIFDAVHAVEIDPDYQEALRYQGACVYDSLLAVQEQVDLAWSFNVLEHIDDDQLALDQLVCKLKPGGRLVIFVPAFDCLYSRMDAAVGHVRRYHMGDLSRKIEKAGAHIDKSCYIDSLGFFAAGVYRLCGGSGTLNSASIRNYDRFVFPMSRLMDRLAAPFFGKNVLIHAHKPRE